MNKYLNVIIVSFFTVLLSKVNLGLSIFVPTVSFFILNNRKTILLIIPVSFISVYFLCNELMIPYLVFIVTISLYVFLLNNRRTNLLDCIFIIIFNLFSFVLVNESIELRQFIAYLIISIVGMILYVYYLFNYSGSFKEKVKFRSFSYIEVVMAILCVIGASQLSFNNINVGLIVAVFYAMYLSQNMYTIQSLFFGLASMFYFKFYLNIEEGIIIPFVSSFYLFPKIYGSIALISFSILALYIEQNIFSRSILALTVFVSIFFEIFKGLLINVDSDKKAIVKNVYEQTVQNLNNEIIGFASFLDMFAKNYATPKEYSIKLSGGINTLIKNYCDCCYRKNECFRLNKGKIYSYFKELILYAKRDDIINSSNSSYEFYRNCPSIIEMRKSCILINQKLNLDDSYNKLNTLIYQINGVSNVLRQYTVDNSMKMEIDYDIFYSIKKALCDFGLNICFYEVKKVLIDDFMIEVGIRNSSFIEIKDQIEKICNKYFPNKVTVIYSFSKPSKTYINIVPKVNYEITYGYGAIAEQSNTVCGDNYIIKQLTNSKLVAAISDGMGKGFLASKESNETIKLIDEITKMPISATTSLQILNTFYFIQDYLEKYSTLDFIEIDRSKGEVIFYKMGAASSYLFHEIGTFDKIINENLPFGIEEMIETKTFKLKDKDLIIMASDGVFENVVNEEELEKFMKQIKHLSPQKIAYEILNFARSHKLKTQDDMSVIALKVELVNG